MPADQHDYDFDRNYSEHLLLYTNSKTVSTVKKLITHTATGYIIHTYVIINTH